MTSVCVSGLHKSFGTRSVLRGLDLDVPDGSLTAVLGPSGSGKTTLLRILAGFERADEGSIALGGRMVEDGRTHLPPEKRKIGFVPQDGALFPHLSVAGNVGFGLSRHKRREGRIEELLEMVGLSGEGRRYPHQLSGGQQQRVALARALAGGPSLVLLDEPFSALDATMRAEVRADVQRVLREATATAILVTHDQDEALSLADQVAVLRDGRVAQCGSPEDLYIHPLDPDMARFIGDANLLEGVARAGAAVTALGTLPLAEDSPVLAEAQRLLVLVRPEQVSVSSTTTEGGLAGSVVESHYFGHDTVTTVESWHAGSAIRFFARLPGGSPIEAGTAVVLTAHGPVVAWPHDALGSAILGAVPRSVDLAAVPGSGGAEPLD